MSRRRAPHVLAAVGAVWLLAALCSGCGAAGEARTGIGGKLLCVGMFGGTEPSTVAQVAVFRPGATRALATGKAGSDGSFFVSLDPGRYEYALWDGHGCPLRQSVAVTAGRVADLGTSILGDAPGISRLPTEAQRVFGAARVRVLGLTERIGADVIGTTADGAHRYFGAASPTGERHVWIFVISGRSGSRAARSAETEALRHGGYVAYELDAATLEILATRTSGHAWSWPPWVGDTLWSPAVGFELKPAG